MVDNILINITNTHIFECQTDTIARSGEANTPIMRITFPERFIEKWSYLDFKKPNGETFRSPCLETEGNVATFPMPLYLLDTDGVLEVQFVTQDESGLVWKTYTKKFNVKYSINAVDDIPEKEDFIADAQKSIDEMNETIETLRKEGVTGAVLFTRPQELTDEERYQARMNIGALDVVAHITGDAENGYISSLRYDVMVWALEHGYTLSCEFDGMYMPLVERGENSLTFVVSIGGVTITASVTNDDEVFFEVMEQSIKIGDQMWDGIDNNNVDFTDTIHGMIDNKVQEQNDAINQIGEELQSLGKDVDDALSTVNEGMQALNEGMQTVNEDLQNLNEKADGINDIHEDLQTFKQETSEAFADTETALQTLNQANEELSAKVDGIGSGEWTYYKKITLEENTKEVTPTFEKGKYTEMLVRVKFKTVKGDGVGNVYITIGGANREGAYVRISCAGSTSKNNYYMCEGHMSGGGYPVYYAAGSDNHYSGGTISTNLLPSAILKESKYLPAFSIYTATEGVEFATGSIFEVWGR